MSSISPITVNKTPIDARDRTLYATSGGPTGAARTQTSTTAYTLPSSALLRCGDAAIAHTSAVSLELAIEIRLEALLHPGG